MVSFTLTALTLGLLGSTLALPQPAANSTVEPSPSLDKRGVQSGVYYCTGYNFKGQCWHIGVAMGMCNDVNDPARRGKMSSFGPDWEVTCDLFKGRGCSGKKRTVGYPGIKDLRTIFFDNAIASYNCREMPAVQPN